MVTMKSDPVIPALEEQLGCYRRLAKLAELQHEHVQQSRTEDLLAVLVLRQEVLDQVGMLEQTIGPAKRRWAEYLGELDGSQRAKAEALLAATRELLETITAADRNDALVLQQRKLNVGREINQAKAARQINRSYAVAAYGSRGSRMDVQR